MQDFSKLLPGCIFPLFMCCSCIWVHNAGSPFFPPSVMFVIPPKMFLYAKNRFLCFLLNVYNAYSIWDGFPVLNIVPFVWAHPQTGGSQVIRSLISLTFQQTSLKQSLMVICTTALFSLLVYFHDKIFSYIKFLNSTLNIQLH